MFVEGKSVKAIVILLIHIFLQKKETSKEMWVIPQTNQNESLLYIDFSIIKIYIRLTYKSII